MSVLVIRVGMWESTACDGLWFVVYVQHALLIYTISLSGDASLCVGGQALAKPHLLPGGIGDGVAEPSVGDLVDHVDQQELPALQDGRDDERQTRVLHGNDGEGGRQEHNVVSVAKTKVYPRIMH